MTKPRTPTSGPITPAITGLFAASVEEISPALPQIRAKARELLDRYAAETESEGALRRTRLDTIYSAVGFDALTIGGKAPDTPAKAVASLLYAYADWMRSDTDLVLWLANREAAGSEQLYTAILTTPLVQRAVLIKRLAGDDAALLASSRTFLPNELAVLDRLAAYNNEENSHAA